MEHIVTAPRKTDNRVQIVKANIVSGRYSNSSADPFTGEASRDGLRSIAARDEVENLPAGWQEFLRCLPLEILSIKNKGKFLFFELSGGVSLWSTLGMSGGWTLRPHNHSRIELHIESDNQLLRNENDGCNDNPNMV